MKVRLFLCLLGLLVFFVPSVSHAAPCTDGVDCYCDRVLGGDFADPALLFCEDFEAVTLHDDTNRGGGGPLYGPWYDSPSGNPGFRGGNNYWQRKFGGPTGTCAWSNGTPSSPQRGTTCTFGVCGPAEWRADNLWGGNNFACLDIVQAGEFNDEIASLTEPGNAADGGSGPFDGRQSLGHRVRAGSTAGITGSASFPRRVYDLGVTQAIAYPINSNSSGIWNHPWKHDEYEMGGKISQTIIGHNSGSRTEGSPWSTLVLLDIAGFSEAACNNRRNNANVRRGALRCNDTALEVTPDTTLYRRTRDWPDGQWGCTRVHYTNMNSPNMGIKVWFQGPGQTTETLIIDFDGFDDRNLIMTSGGATGVHWNSYANANQGQGATPTTQTTYRYQDNMHVREGTPVSCSQIGFGSSPDTTPPAAPVNLQVQ